MSCPPTTCGKHYMAVLKDKKVSAAKLLLEQTRIAVAERASPSGSSALPAVKDAAVERYNNFFGFAKNIFLGNSKENSEIQENLDTRQPEAGGQEALGARGRGSSAAGR